MPLHPVLKRSALFRAMSDEEIIAVLRLMGTKEHVYARGDVVLPAGEPVARMGFVFQGSVTITREGPGGTPALETHVEPGCCFAESFAILSDEPLPATVTANEPTRILFLRVGILRETTRPAEPSLVKFTANLLALTAQNEIALSDRAFHTAPKTIRGRVLAYLGTVARRKQSDSFEIPFNRKELADYLNVERSALSKELSKMQSEGLIETKKNRFVLRRTE